CFGEFVLKSGRRSPYFFNSGLFNSGKSIARLGHYYAAAIENSNIAYDLLFGPAYKGIPLAVATAIALSHDHQRDVPYAFNRKEIKDHGEGGLIVGAKLSGRVLIIDDVISAGTSVRESIDIIRAQQAEPAGVVIAMDRQERGQGKLSAIQEVEQQFHLQVTSIVTLGHLISYLSDKPAYQNTLAAIERYRAQWQS
ncbi:MAG: orotate phosphoribosyltransferase, partial [Halothiobacillaceae bacterium]